MNKLDLFSTVLLTNTEKDKHLPDFTDKSSTVNLVLSSLTYNSV